MKTQRMKRFSPLVSSLSALVAVAAFALGTTSALFSGTQAGAAQEFTSGTVSVGLGATSTTCNVTDLMPGDSSSGYGSGSLARTQCTYNVKYTGNASAWLAADIAISSAATTLYTADSGGLQFKVKAGSTSLMSGTSFTQVGGSSSTVANNDSVSNILLSTTPASENDLISFTIDYLLPLSAANALQGGSSALTLTFHAVQSANQPIGSCVAGRQCNTITWG